MLWSLSHIDTNKHRSPNPFSCLQWLLIILQTISESYCVADSAVFQMGKRMAFARTAPFLVEKQSPEKTRIQCSHCLWPTALPWPHNKPPKPGGLLCGGPRFSWSTLGMAGLGSRLQIRSQSAPHHSHPPRASSWPGHTVLRDRSQYKTRGQPREHASKPPLRNQPLTSNPLKKVTLLNPRQGVGKYTRCIHRGLSQGVGVEGVGANHRHHVLRESGL